MNQNRKLPEPRVSSPTAQFAALDGAQILLTKPSIKLDRHVQFFIDGKLEQLDRLEPESAVIVGGVIVIREWNILVPLDWAFIRSRDANR